MATSGAGSRRSQTSSAINAELTVISEMNDGGTLFGDGSGEDAIAFRWGIEATVGVAKGQLRLVRA